jgi:hypothetical protein
LNLQSLVTLASLDIRRTKISKLDLRTFDPFWFDARGTKVTVRVADPVLFANAFQTTIDPGVTIKK